MTSLLLTLTYLIINLNNTYYNTYKYLKIEINIDLRVYSLYLSFFNSYIENLNKNIRRVYIPK